MCPSSSGSLRLAYISGGFPTWALFVAKSQGFFEAQNVHCDITHTGASTAQMLGLREGRFDVGLQLPDHVVRAGLYGTNLCVLAAQSHAPDVALVASPNIQAIEQLKGHRIAVDGARSGYALLLAKLFSSLGWRSNDYQLVEVGDSQQRVQALRSGELMASFINPPLDKALVKDGFIRLTTTREAFPSYPGPVVAARREWADAHPQLAKGFQNAWSKSWQWLLDTNNQSQAIEIALQHLGAEAPAAQNALQNLQRQGMPQIAAEGMAQVIALVWSHEDVGQKEMPHPGIYFWPATAA
jgi:ABC-type nitrate/sulfonate/bicarbonate transport system substrate-binding protein